MTGRSIDSAEDEIKATLKQITFPTEYHAEVVTDKATGYRGPEQLSALFDRSRDRRLPPAPGNLRLMDLALLSIVAHRRAGRRRGGPADDRHQPVYRRLSRLPCPAWPQCSQRHHAVQRYQALEQADAGRTGTEIAALGGDGNALAVVITALAAAVAFLPVLFAGTIPGLELMQPLAIVVLGASSCGVALLLLLSAAVWSPSVRSYE